MNNSNPQTAHELLFAKYSRKPPVQAIARLETELNLIGEGFMRDVILLARLREAAEEAGASLDADGTINASLIAWLYDASDVNPLPPHYRCPKCKKVIFSCKGDGFDLPPMECCGEAMIRDGHEIPLATVRDLLRTPLDYPLGIRMPESFADQAEEIIREHYSQLKMELVPFKEDLKYNRFFYLVPEKDLHSYYLDDEEPHRPSADRLREKGYREVQLNFVKRRDQLQELRKQSGRVPAIEELLDPSVLAVTEAKIRGEILKEGATPLVSGEPSFEGVLKVLGYYYSSHTEDNPVYIGDDAKYTDLFTSREEVFHLVNRALQPEYGVDSGFPAMIMKHTRMGRFTRNGMTPETEYALRALGIEERWIAQMKHTYYLSSRATLIISLLDRLKLTWYELQEEKQRETPVAEDEIATRACIECGKEFNTVQARAEFNAYFAPYAIDYKDCFSSGSTCASCAIRKADKAFVRE